MGAQPCPKDNDLDLLLIRHGLPEKSRSTSDVPLSATGQAQAERVAARLADEPIDAIWSSTMQRAIETAAPLARTRALAINQHPQISEYDRNSGEYIPIEELRVTDPAAFAALASGGPGVDLAAFQAEVVTAIEAIITAHAGERVAVFCHGGVINVWTAHVLGMPVQLFFEPRYTSINRFICGAGGRRTLVSLNDHAHL